MTNIKLPFKDSLSKIIISWMGVLIGSLLIAVAYVLFNTPYNITPGGVYGLAIVINNFLPDVMIGTIGLVLDIPLLIISFIIFGRGSGMKTIAAALILPLIMNLLTMLVGGTDPLLILSGKINLTNDLLLASIFGGVLTGVGLGIIVKCKATSGGTDVVGMIMTKYLKMPFSKSMLIVESCVIISGLVVFGDWKLPLYSLISLFITSKVIDMIIEGTSTDKLLFIISDKHEEIKEHILNDLERGGTYLKASGMYTKTDKMVIFVVISRKQLPIIKDVIKEIDETAFLTIVNAHEIMGDGFKSFIG